jgi:putative aldouronate transport system permease protein
MTIMKIGGILRADFGLFYQLTRDVGTLYPTTDVIDTYIFRTMRVLGDMGISSAVGLLQSGIGLLMVIAANYISGKIDEDNALF